MSLDSMSGSKEETGTAKIRTEERHGAGVPIGFGAGAEVGVGFGEEVAGGEGCDVAVEVGIEGEGGEDLVGVEGEGSKGEGAGQRVGELDERRRSWDWISHFDAGGWIVLRVGDDYRLVFMIGKKMLRPTQLNMLMQANGLPTLGLRFPACKCSSLTLNAKRLQHK